MSKNDTTVGRIEAVIFAAESIINRCPDRETEINAKETAYDHIKNIINGTCPWEQE